MADLGFKELSIEPVVAPPEADYALKEEDLPVILEQYDFLAKEMLKREKEGRGFTFYHYMIDLEGGPCVVKRISGCGVGTEYLAVTANGDLYPCHQFAGEEKFKLGNVFDGITDESARDDFKECNIYSRKECSKCFARMYCSGGCAANSMHTMKPILITLHFILYIQIYLHAKIRTCGSVNSHLSTAGTTYLIIRKDI